MPVRLGFGEGRLLGCGFGALALFIGGFLYISFHTGLVKLERYPMQRNIAIAVVALLAIGFSWWWFSRGTAG